MILMLALWVLGSYALSWWQNHQLDSTYGMPRTYQTDQVVGHSDSAEPPDTLYSDQPKLAHHHHRNPRR